jgi:hypothetical protein
MTFHILDISVLWNHHKDPHAAGNSILENRPLDYCINRSKDHYLAHLTGNRYQALNTADQVSADNRRYSRCGLVSADSSSTMSEFKIA